MSPKEAWDLLGIDPTDDKCAVKRTYATKLRAFDPDTDPNYFLALHSARGIALGTAQLQPLPTEAEVENRSTFVSKMAPSSSWAEFETGQVRSSEVAKSLIDQIVRLLWSRGKWSAELDRKLSKLVRQFLDSGDLDDVDSYSKSEAFLAQLIVETMPRSDCIIESVIAHYGWARSEEVLEISRRPAPEFVPDILQRMDDLTFRLEVDEPSHYLHHALTLLRCPPKGDVNAEYAARWGVRVAALLNNIHLYYPTLKREIDQDHYETWMDFFDPQFLSDDGLIEFSYNDPKAEYLNGLKGCLNEIGAVIGFFIFIIIVIVVFAMLKAN